MRNLVKVEEGKQAEAKRCLSDLQELCSAKSCKVPESVSKVAGLAVELVSDAVVTSSPGAGSIFDPRIDGLTVQLGSTRTEVVSLAAKLPYLEDALDKDKREHKRLVRRIRAETKTAKDYDIAERDWALYPYRGVLRSVRGIF